jgi:hypothetical protein
MLPQPVTHRSRVPTGLLRRAKGSHVPEARARDSLLLVTLLALTIIHLPEGRGPVARPSARRRLLPGLQGRQPAAPVDGYATSGTATLVMVRSRRAGVRR